MWLIRVSCSYTFMERTFSLLHLHKKQSHEFRSGECGGQIVPALLIHVLKKKWLFDQLCMKNGWKTINLKPHTLINTKRCIFVQEWNHSLEEIIVLDLTKTICSRRWFSGNLWFCPECWCYIFCWNEEHKVTCEFKNTHSCIFSRLCIVCLVNFVSSARNIKMLELFEEPSCVIVLINLKV